MKAVSARCGHVKRRLKAGERLTGGLLEFALGFLPEDDSPASSELLAAIRNKLVTGQPLGEYEYHVFVEVILLHARLGAA